MKRLLWVWLFICLTFGFSLYFGRDFFLNLLRQKVESSAEVFGVQLKIGHLALSWFPLSLELEGVHLEIPLMMSGDLKGVKVVCSLAQILDRQLGLELKIHDGEIQWLMKDKETSVERVDTSHQMQGQKAMLPLAVGLQVLVQRVTVHAMKSDVTAASVQVTELKVATPTLRDPGSPLRIDFLGEVEVLNMKMPTQVHVPALYVSDSEIKSEKVDVAVLGLTSLWNVAASLDGSQVKVDGQLNVADLKTIPKSAYISGVESLEGSLSARVTAEVQRPSPPNITALIKSPEFAVFLNRKEGSSRAKGPVRGEVDVHVVFQKNQLQVDRSQMRLDLQDVDLEIAPYFHKTSGVPFVVEAAIDGNQEELKVSKLNVQLADAMFANRLSIRDPLKEARIRFETELQPVSLSRLGQLSPMVGKFPLSGRLAARASGEVLANEPLRGQIHLQNLSLKDVRGNIDVEKSAFRTKGPFHLNLEASSLVQSGAIKKLDAKGELGHGPIQLKFAGAIKDQHSFAGQFVGQVSSIERLSKMLPSVNNPKLEGAGDFNIQVAGPLDLSRPPLEWPLKTSGGVHLKLAKIQFSKVPQQSLGSVAAAGAGVPAVVRSPVPSNVGVEVKPLLEKHKLYEGLNLYLNSEVSLAEWDQLQLQGVRLKSTVSAQGLRGTLSVAQVFGGRVSMSDMSVNPFKTKPFFLGELGFSQLNIGSALNYLKPESARLISGLAEGQMSISSNDPRMETFLDELRVGGRVVLTQAQIKSLPLVEMAHGFLSKIPGAVQTASAQAKDVPMTGQMTFQLANRVASLKPLNVTSERQDELGLNGSVNLDLSANLQGEFKLAQPPVGGSFLAANQDEKGRLVLPLHIEGNLLSPKVAFVGTTLDKMVRNTLEYEKNKALKKVTESVKKNVEDELKKRLKGIFGR